MIQISNKKYNKTKNACSKLRKLRFGALRLFSLRLQIPQKKKYIEKRGYVIAISMNSCVHFNRCMINIEGQL